VSTHVHASIRFRTLFLCLALEVGLMAGVPMRPDEIARLMRALAGPQVEQTGPDEAARGDGGPPEEPRIP
jgi:hypothetical protein